MGETSTEEAIDTGALAAFVKARSKTDPMWLYRNRAEAAENLLAGVLRAAKAAGIREKHDGHNQLLSLGRTTVCLRLVDDKVEFGRQDETGEWRTGAIDFDPVTKEFVGREEDTSRHPVPGGPKLRRTAVAVVSEHIALLLTSDP